MNRRTFIKMAGIAPYIGTLRFEDSIKSSAETEASQGSVAALFDKNQSGRLVMIASRPAMGKISFLLNLVNDLGIDSRMGCLFFSLELSKDALKRRLLSIKPSSNLYINDSAGISIQELCSSCKNYKIISPDLKFVFVDYFQLIDSEIKHKNRRDRSSYILKQLNQIAHELNVTVIVAGQLNRSVENRTDRRPRPEDLREIRDLSSIDELLLLYRDSYYDKSFARNILEVTKFENNLKTITRWSGEMSRPTQKISNFKRM